MYADLLSKIILHLEESKQLKLMPLIAVIGPTASGKTSLGIALANSLSGEIISADSRQIYQHMDIGSALPTPAERKQAIHHLIDFVKPDQSFSLAEYQALANQVITQVISRHKIPILVGGTGLYINTVSQNYLLPDSQPDLQLRDELTQLANQSGYQAVHDRLSAVDPQSAANIHPHNLRYVIRALEIATHTQKPKSDQLAASLYHTFYIFIDWPRDLLYQRIEQRIDQQIKQGLIEETKSLLALYDQHLPSMSSLGYQEIGDYLRGQISLDQALVLFKQHARNYAKRQLTWFRKIKPLYSISGLHLSELITTLKTVTLDNEYLP